MRRARFAAALGLIVALLLPGAAAVAAGPDDVIVTVPDGAQAPGSDREITNAQLRWGLSSEAGSAAFAGGCNFLSAGRAASAGTSRVWTEGDGFYKPADGRVRVEKPVSGGGWSLATWASRCQDAAGRTVSFASLSSVNGNQVVIDGGTGRQTAAGLEIRWRGSFTVVFYGGMTYWSVTDPVLALDARGNGRLTGTASGYGASMDDTSRWDPLPERSIVLAEIRGADIASNGFATVPEYLGVTAAARFEQKGRDSSNAAYWGAFPESFLDYQQLTGQLGFWLTTGGVRDPAKPASTLYVSVDAAAAVPPPAPEASESGGAGPVNTARFRPSAAEAALAPTPPSGIAAGSPLTFVPQRDGLVPAAVAAALSPAAAPLLGAALALLVSIIAVLNMMGMLPWQQARQRP